MQEDLLELLQTRGWHSAYDARAGGAYLVYDGPDNPFDRWFLSVETARSLGQKLDLIRNAELAGIIVWEASLDTKNHSFAAQLRDTLLRYGGKAMQYGHFDNQSREYVIDRVDLPVSWTNYIGVGDLYGVFNHTAGGMCHTEVRMGR